MVLGWVSASWEELLTVEMNVLRLGWKWTASKEVHTSRYWLRWDYEYQCDHDWSRPTYIGRGRYLCYLRLDES